MRGYDIGLAPITKRQDPELTGLLSQVDDLTCTVRVGSSLTREFRDEEACLFGLGPAIITSSRSEASKSAGDYHGLDRPGEYTDSYPIVSGRPGNDHGAGQERESAVKLINDFRVMRNTIEGEIDLRTLRGGRGLWLI
jgi:hypothetical protein